MALDQYVVFGQIISSTFLYRNKLVFSVQCLHTGHWNRVITNMHMPKFALDKQRSSFNQSPCSKFALTNNAEQQDWLYLIEEVRFLNETRTVFKII